MPYVSNWYPQPIVETTGAYINKDTGVVVSNAGWKYAKFEVPEGVDAVRVSAITSGSSTALAVYYDADDDYIGNQNPAGATVEYVNYQLTLPPGTRYVAITTTIDRPPITADFLLTTFVLDIFPQLPGLTFDLQMTPNFNTGVFEASSGNEVRTSYQAYPKWDYELSYEWLPNRDRGRADLEKILGFFLQRQGSFESFLYEPPEVVYQDQVLLGTGDGVETTFRLMRSIGGFLEPVGGVIDKLHLEVFVNGTPVDINDFELVDQRDVTFNVAPTDGAEIKASFIPLLRVRFKEDSADFSQFASRLWELQSISLRSVF